MFIITLHRSREICYSWLYAKGCEDTIADLRWLLFSKYSCKVSKLPPTMSVLKYRIFRTHYAALILKKCISSIQNLPDQCGFGWELDNGNLVPIMTGGLPAPTGLIELSMFSCKTGFSSGRFTCKKNNLLCIEMCKCSDTCENSDCNEKEVIYESEDETSDFEWYNILSNLLH